MKNRKNWIIFIAVVLMWGSSFQPMKIALTYVNASNFIAQRFALSALFLSPILIFMWKRIPKNPKTIGKLVLVGVIAVSFELLMNTGLRLEQSGISAMITYTQPLFVFSLSLLFLAERAKLWKLFGILVGFLGVSILLTRNISALGALSYSIGLLIIGAFLWAVSIVYYKKSLSNTEPVVTNIFVLVVGAIFSAIVSLIGEGFYFPSSTDYLIPLLYSAGIPASLGGTLWFLLLRDEEATVVSSSSLLIPITAFFFGWLILGESLDTRAIVSACLTMTGLYIVNRK